MQTELFDGSTFVPERDGERLSRQLALVRELMMDGQWRTLRMIEEATGAPQASISARLRDLRKDKFGGWIVDRRYLADGLFEYQVLRPR